MRYLSPLVFPPDIGVEVGSPAVGRVLLRAIESLMAAFGTVPGVADTCWSSFSVKASLFVCYLAHGGHSDEETDDDEGWDGGRSSDLSGTGGFCGTFRCNA